VESTATRQAADDAIEKMRSEMRVALYSEAACPTETVFFAFRLKGPGCFFWGGTSEGSAPELLRISVRGEAHDAQRTPDFFGFNAQDELQYRGRLDASRMAPMITTF
jgi:hypothetical protein